MNNVIMGEDRIVREVGTMGRVLRQNNMRNEVQVGEERTKKAIVEEKQMVKT